MNKIRSLSILLGLTFLTLGATSSCKPGAPVTLTILHTNDLHSRLRASKNDPFGLGGFARIKTLMDRLRGEAQLSLTLDAGDWSEGAWYFSVDGGSNLLRFMNELGYDAVCVGNHDLLNGPDQLIATVRDAKPNFPVLAANLDVKKYARGQELRENVPRYAIRDVSGLKVGIIGLTIAPGTYDSMMEPVKIQDPVQAAKDVAFDLRNKVDVLLVVSHNEIGTNRRIAREVPGVDAVISGHTHIKTPEPFFEMNEGRKVPVVETGYWGKFVGELKLEIQTSPTVDKQGPISTKSYRLHPVTPDIPEDPKIVELIDEQDKILSDRYGRDVHEVVNHAEVDIDQADFQESMMGALAVKSYRAATGADAAVEAQSFTGIGIAAGPVTVMDLHDVLPHTYDPLTGKEWTLKIWSAWGKDLEKFFDTFFLLTGILPTSSPLGWLQADNMSFTWTPILGKTSLNVKGLLIGGKPVNPLQRYRIAVSDGVLMGLQVLNSSALAGIFGLKMDISDVKDTGIEAWQAVLDYGSVAGNLSLENLRLGGRARTNGSDLAIFPYNVNLTEQGLDVTVENAGSKKADESKVKCFTGLADNFVAYNSDAQKWTLIGTTPLVAIPQGRAFTVSIPWEHSQLRGYWPIKCEVEGGGRYKVNNKATRVYRLGHTGL